MKTTLTFFCCAALALLVLLPVIFDGPLTVQVPNTNASETVKPPLTPKRLAGWTYRHEKPHRYFLGTCDAHRQTRMLAI